MKVILLLALLAPLAHASMEASYQSDYAKLSSQERAYAKRQVRAFKEELRSGDLVSVARRADGALDVLVDRGLKALDEAGDGDYARMRRFEWHERFSGYLTRMMLSSQWDIGDHKPLIAWLATFYDRLELVLGISVCTATHLSDIKTFNYTIPVVFKPCTFPMDSVTVSREDEYRNHFAQGEYYYGLVPVVTYWVVNISCMVATQGAGVVWLCGPIGGVAEYLMGTWAAPKLSDMLFERVCK